MDFFQAQESARSRSRTLVLLFVAAVVAIIVSIYAVVHVAFGPGLAGGVDWGLLLLVAVGTTLLVLAGSAFRTIQLRQGGSRVAEMLGGRRVRPNTTDEAERRLVNVVEEMSIAAGTPVPAIFVMDQEQGINAFAAGYTLDDAAVAVTRGTLAHLNRDELQGVIAHEFSHILNGDMKLNIRLIGLLFGILLLAVVGRGLLYSGGRGGRGRRDGEGGQVALLGIALVVVGYIGVLFGRLIQAAVSRQREYLADAAAVQFTRNPDGIADALKKIGGAGSRMENPHAQEVGHLFFASGLRSSFAGLLSTHPPLPDRIKRIDPAFDGRFPTLEAMAEQERIGSGEGLAAVAEGTAGFAGAAARRERPPIDARQESRSEALMASIGMPQPEHVAYAARLLRSLPEPVVAASHDPDEAVALMFALLLHDEGEAAAAQRRAIESYGGEDLPPRVHALARAIAPLGPAARLPLLDLLLPAVRGGELSPDQTRRMLDAAAAMVAADGRKDMFELALLHVLARQLAAGAGGSRAQETRETPHSLDELHREIVSVLSALAWTSASDERAAAEAFAAGIGAMSPNGSTLRPRASTTMEEIDSALGRLADAPTPFRRRVMQACVNTVAHDGRVGVGEAEMLRAVAEALDLPMPPLLPGGAV